MGGGSPGWVHYGRHRAIRKARAAREQAALLWLIEKYSPDQPRDDHGRWTDGGGGDGATTENLAAGRQLGVTSVDMADRIFPGGYDVSPNAPNTYEKLVSQWDKTHRMVVYSGASDKTIFGSAKENYAFRAWHDATHLRIAAPFTPEGEARVAEAQIQDLRRVYGNTRQVAGMANMIRAEINGQVQYAQAHNGEFPVDQRGFDIAWLKNARAAVDRVWKALIKSFDRRHDWGRLRDTEAGLDHYDFYPSPLARKVSAEFESRHGGRVVIGKYSPDQERVPAGQPGGGEFAPGGGFHRAMPSDFITARDRSTRVNYLSPLKPSDLTEHQLYLNHDNTIGVAISKDGDIQNLFNNGGGKGGAAEAMNLAIAKGGKTLDCYAGFLPAYYSRFGFVETGRVAFDPAYAPKGWDYVNNDSPDVVFMKRRKR